MPRRCVISPVVPVCPYCFAQSSEDYAPLASGLATAASTPQPPSCGSVFVPLLGLLGLITQWSLACYPDLASPCACSALKGSTC